MPLEGKPFNALRWHAGALIGLGLFASRDSLNQSLLLLTFDVLRRFVTLMLYICATPCVHERCVRDRRGDGSAHRRRGRARFLPVRIGRSIKARDARPAIPYVLWLHEPRRTQCRGPLRTRFL